ncbi:MAG: TetR/AcrR family transcriptional regulator [Deltaproteobacteria bacterium]|nr:TetR/AcrR family transcriptional regulator [Deltaproteobacteria bacterium]
MLQTQDHFSPNKGASHSQNGRLSRNREKIFRAATRLFWQRGYKGTSLNDIAKTARVNKGTIYYHFKNKMAILFEITVSAIYEIITLAQPIVEADIEPVEKLDALIDNHIRWLVSHPGRVGFYTLNKLNLTPKFFSDYLNTRNAYVALFQKVIDEGVEKGTFYPINSHCDALFVVTFLNSLVQRIGSNRRFSVDEIVSSARNVVARALKNR